VRESNSLINISTFAPTLEPGGEHTVLIIPTTTANVYSFLELVDDYSPGANQSGLRVVNAATGAASYDVYVTEPGAAITGARASGITYGNASAFFSVPAGTAQQVRLTNAGTTTVAFDLGNTSFVPGEKYTLVVGTPAPNSTTRRPFFIVHNCR
jgi:trimeric autotransporter adhesin